MQLMSKRRDGICGNPAVADGDINFSVLVTVF